MITIEHNKKKCIGCGFCRDVAPAFWELNLDDGKCDLIEARKINEIFILDIFPEDLNQVKRSIDICPTKCIKIRQ